MSFESDRSGFESQILLAVGSLISLYSAIKWDLIKSYIEI